MPFRWIYIQDISKRDIQSQYIFGIHLWRSFRSSYRKLAWVGFKPTTTEFRSEALSDWAIKPWVQLTLRANFVQLLQFHLFAQYSHFISAIAFVIRHIYLKRNLAQVITLVAEWIYTHGIHHWKISIYRMGALDCLHDFIRYVLRSQLCACWVFCV